MENLVERVARALDTHPAPALPLPELRRLVRGSGVLVTEGALLRALSGAADRFRLVDPWKGPWSALRAHGHGIRSRSAVRTGSHRGAARAPSSGGGDAVLPGVGARWVVARPGAGSGRSEGRVPGRLRESVAHLGWTLDDRSPCDMARWCRMVLEARRVRERLREGRGSRSA